MCYQVITLRPTSHFVSRNLEIRSRLPDHHHTPPPPPPPPYRVYWSVEFRGWDCVWEDLHIPLPQKSVTYQAIAKVIYWIYSWNHDNSSFDIALRPDSFHWC